MTRWVKIPGPGQYRGEGEWKRIDDDTLRWTKDKWEAARDTGWLPTHEGDEPPAEEAEAYRRGVEDAANVARLETLGKVGSAEPAAAIRSLTAPDKP